MAAIQPSRLLLLMVAVAVALCPGPSLSTPHRHRHSHTKTHHKTHHSKTVTHRHRARELATNADSTSTYTLQFVLLANTSSADCVDGDVSVELSYRAHGGDWERLCVFTRTPGECNGNREEVSLPQDSVNQGAVQFRWRQLEQTWGACNCWQIDDVSITPNGSPRLVNFAIFGDARELDDDFVCTHYGASAGRLSSSCLDDDGLVFCGGSASVPRGVVTPMYNLTTGEEVTDSCTGSDLFDPIGDVQLCDGTRDPFIKVSFHLSFNMNAPSTDATIDNQCDALEAFDEGVELSLRTLENEDGPWVPLKFYTVSSVATTDQPEIDLGSSSDSILSLRGYNVSVVAGGTSVMDRTEYICDERFFREEVQFRWLQTAWRSPNTAVRDTWFIDDVEITVHGSQNSSRVEFYDDFSNRISINNTLWPQVRGGGLGGADTVDHIGAACVPNDIVLFFGAFDTDDSDMNAPEIVSRMAVTMPLDLVPAVDECTAGIANCGENANCIDTDGSFTCTCREGYMGNGTVCTDINECVTRAPCDMNADCANTDGSFTCTCRQGYRGNGTVCTNINECVTRAPCDMNANCTDTDGSFTCTCREGFTGNGTFCVSLEAERAAQLLMDLFNNTEEMPPSQIILTVRSLLGNLSEGVTFPPETSELLFNSVSGLIDTVQASDDDEDDVGPVGSTLLDVMDTFALGPYDPEQEVLEDANNIALLHMIQNGTVMPDDDPSEEVEGISRDSNSIRLPREVFMNFNMTMLPVASYFYPNMSGLLPDSTPEFQNSSNTTMTLASGVLSSALQCGSTQCNTRDLNLEHPVVLVFNHSSELVQIMQRQDDQVERSIMCVFWEFDDSTTNELSNGQWATEGCNMTASNESHTVCECNHLTHFALLLSTTEVQLTSAEALSLRIIGIICVTISLVCLTITILTFLFLKSLWSMRNYIHVNLCVSLFVAQLTFIVAVEPHGSVVGCQAVAVLLHYFFMVTFMWMLMEGVVLYVALVRVFIKHQKRYLIAFTLASYGLPLLYLGVTVPLGFVLQNADGPHYAGDDPQSCWLRYDSHFIWAFIAPVIVITLANIGFFIMAITIMYRHQRRQTHKTKLDTLKHWLKASISLVVVMGITWIIGILVFNRDLLFVAYIYTIFIGLQGLFIFVLFVVLSKQVREAYTKWWKVKVASSDFLSRHFGEKSYASQTAMTALGTTINRNTSLKSKSQGTHISPSPSPDLTDNGRVGTLRKEEKQDNSVFNVTFIKGITSFGLTPVPVSEVGGGVDEENEVETPDAVANGGVLRLEQGGLGEEEHGDIRTLEPNGEITQL